MALLKGKWLDTDGSQKASMRPNAAYYITKVVVPALSRCLSLVGADVLSWSTEMPKLKSVQRLLPYSEENFCWDKAGFMY